MIKWIIFCFDSREPLDVFTVDILQVVIALTDKIHVSTASGERLGGSVEIARPRNTFIVLIRFLPARMHIHDELNVPMRISCGILSDAIDRAANLGNEYFRLRAWQLCCAFHNAVY